MRILRMIVIVLLVLSIFGGANYYIARRVYQSLNAMFSGINVKVYVILYIFIVLTIMITRLPLPGFIRTAAGWVSAYWMGVFVYALLLFLAADLVLLLGGIVKIIPRPMPQTVRMWSGAVVILLTAGVLAYGTFNAARLKHVSYDIWIEGHSLNEGMKIALVSDFHLGALRSEKKLEAVVKGLNSLEPDIVCIAGDIFDNDYSAIRAPDKAIDLLKSVKSTYGVYACMGNHDGGSTYGEMVRFLEQSGVRLLNDEYEIVNDSLILIGRLDSSPIGGFNGESRKDIADILALIDREMPVVVMDHNPQRIGQYGEGIDLILSGHTHKGQIFPGNLITRAMYETDYGYYQKGANSPHVVVTSGTGTWGMPIRVGTSSEIVVITLRSEE